MKKAILSLSLIFLITTITQAQYISPYFVDGVVYAKLVDEYPLDFEVDIKNGRTIESSEFPFLHDLLSKYEVTGIAQNFYLFDDPKLLRTLTIGFEKMELVDAFIDELQLLKEIEYAEKLVIKKKYFSPNDPYYGSMSVQNYSFNMKWHLDLIKASYTWDIQVGSPNVKVAIIDNAIWGEHEDLEISSSNLCYFTGSYNVTTNTGNANPPSSVNQNITCTENSFYYNCPAYDWSHGTHCAGLVGAKNNNSKGVASIGSGVTLMGARIANDNDAMIYFNAGVQWAANKGAKVISMSYGSPYSEQTEQQLLQTAYNRGIILVAAAGNEGEDSDYEGVAANYISYPAGYNSVISVASVNSNKKLSSFSQYGQGRADIAAPGGFTVVNNQEILPNIISTTFCKTQYLRLMGFPISNVYYDGMQGTSMACPIVAGLCGLLVSAYPDITPAQVKNCLQSTAQPLASGSRPIDGNGFINAYSAVLCAQELAGNVAINEMNIPSSQVTIFPNPAKNNVQINCDEIPEKIEIFDVAGRIVSHIIPQSNENSIDISHFNSGIYVIKTILKNQQADYQKLIKQ